MKRKINYLTIFLLILFIINTILVITNNTTYFDNKIYELIISLRNNLLDNIMKTITCLGNTITIIIILILLLIIIDKNNIKRLYTISIVTVCTNIIIKNIIKRIRPNILRLIKQGGYSYPSGHSMISVAVYGYLIYYIYKLNINKYIKTCLITLLLLIIITIGISRIYLGVHYVTDVLGGYIISLTIELFIINNIKFGGCKNDKNGSK